MNSTAVIQSFYHSASGSVTHVVADRQTRSAAVIDSVLDHDPHSGKIYAHSADQVLAYVCEEGMQLDWLLETHAHADHLSAATYLQHWLGGHIATGSGMRDVPAMFEQIFDVTHSETWSRPPLFDRFFDDGEIFKIGRLPVQVLHTPGHTQSCVSFQIGHDVFAGDTLRMPDCGTANCDYLGGDDRALYRSIHRLFRLPQHTRLHLGHGGMTGHPSPRWVSTVAEQRARNVHVRDGVSEADFLAQNRRSRRQLPPGLLA